MRGWFRSGDRLARRRRNAGGRSPWSSIPLIKLVQVALTDGGASVSRVLRSPGLAAAAVHTLVLACVVPLLAVPIGAGLALFLRRSDVPLRGLLRVLVVLPLIIPQFVLGYSWTQAYGRAGFTDTLLGLRWTQLNGPVGIVVVLVVDAAPLCYLLTAAGLATRARPDLEWAARTSGAGTWADAAHRHVAVAAPDAGRSRGLDVRRDAGELRCASGARECSPASRR